MNLTPDDPDQLRQELENTIHDAVDGGNLNVVELADSILAASRYEAVVAELVNLWEFILPEELIEGADARHASPLAVRVAHRIECSALRHAIAEVVEQTKPEPPRERPFALVPDAARDQVREDVADLDGRLSLAHQIVERFPDLPAGAVSSSAFVKFPPVSIADHMPPTPDVLSPLIDEHRRELIRRADEAERARIRQETGHDYDPRTLTCTRCELDLRTAPREEALSACPGSTDDAAGSEPTC